MLPVITFAKWVRNAIYEHISVLIHFLHTRVLSKYVKKRACEEKQGFPGELGPDHKFLWCLVVKARRCVLGS